MYAKRLRGWPFYESAKHSVFGFRFNPIVEFDHFGSIKRGDLWVVVTSPYESDPYYPESAAKNAANDEKAKEMAERLCCELEITRPSPYHPNTVMYAFVPTISTMEGLR